jgi:hypothetical protein
MLSSSLSESESDSKLSTVIYESFCGYTAYEALTRLPATEPKMGWTKICQTPVGGFNPRSLAAILQP